jgi:hypothetical protein
MIIVDIVLARLFVWLVADIPWNFGVSIIQNLLKADCLTSSLFAHPHFTGYYPRRTCTFLYNDEYRYLYNR